jgi:hypothetical protein
MNLQVFALCPCSQSYPMADVVIFLDASPRKLARRESFSVDTSFEATAIARIVYRLKSQWPWKEGKLPIAAVP